MLSDSDLNLIELALDDQLSPAERNELESLLLQKGEAASYLADARKIDQVTSAVVSLKAPASIHKNVQSHLAQSSRHRSRLTRPRLALAASLLLGVGLIGTFTLLDTSQSQLMTGTLANPDRAGLIDSQPWSLKDIVVSQADNGEVILKINRDGPWKLAITSDNASLGLVSQEATQGQKSDKVLNLSGEKPEILRIRATPDAAATAEVQLSVVAAGRILVEETIKIREN